MHYLINRNIDMTTHNNGGNEDNNAAQPANTAQQTLAVTAADLAAVVMNLNAVYQQPAAPTTPNHRITPPEPHAPRKRRRRL